MDKWLYGIGGLVIGGAVIFPVGMYFGLKWSLEEIKKMVPGLSNADLDDTDDLITLIKSLVDSASYAPTAPAGTVGNKKKKKVQQKAVKGLTSFDGVDAKAEGNYGFVEYKPSTEV